MAATSESVSHSHPETTSSSQLSLSSPQANASQAYWDIDLSTIPTNSIFSPSSNEPEGEPDWDALGELIE
ncbi:MAG: hypothetical protein Q9227_005246 [Pyrenula ochraceoflavens]